MVSYKVAKLAKEKGFNIESDKYYCIVPIEEQKVGDVVIEEETYTHIAMGKGEAVWFRYAPITPQSLLQKWLRDIHGVKVIADTEIGLMWVWSIQSIHPEASYTGTSLYSEYAYSTYEEALEAGLEQALKLIDNETIKSKN